ncbi:MAG: hypothetical protein COA36_12070 [Desulfotalea sp.]|nr:MAG: hypothetical protein COA36_12070 [Desulfotalea sp.]
MPIALALRWHYQFVDAENVIAAPITLLYVHSLDTSPKSFLSGSSTPQHLADTLRYEPKYKKSWIFYGGSITSGSDHANILELQCIVAKTRPFFLLEGCFDRSKGTSKENIFTL